MLWYSKINKIKIWKVKHTLHLVKILISSGIQKQKYGNTIVDLPISLMNWFFTSPFLESRPIKWCYVAFVFEILKYLCVESTNILKFSRGITWLIEIHLKAKFGFDQRALKG